MIFELDYFIKITDFGYSKILIVPKDDVAFNSEKDAEDTINFIKKYVDGSATQNLRSLFQHVTQCRICIEKGLAFCDNVQRIKGVVLH